MLSLWLAPVINRGTWRQLAAGECGGGGLRGGATRDDVIGGLVGDDYPIGGKTCVWGIGRDLTPAIFCIMTSF